MFHLFKKVYVAFDDMIDINNDRLVISETNGVGMLHDLDGVADGELKAYAKSLEELIGEGKQFENFLLFLNFLNRHFETTNRKLIIYCDKISHQKLITTWIKILLPNASFDTAYGILASHVFQVKMFGTSTLSTYIRPYRLTQEDNYTSQLEYFPVFQSIQVDRNVYSAFLTYIKDSISIEYILASYVYNGSCKEELKKIALEKLKVGVQNYLLECKAYLLSNLVNKSIISKFQPTVTYDLSNLNDVVSDPAFDVWFEKSLWDTESITAPHTNGGFYFNRLTSSQKTKLVEHLKIYFEWYSESGREFSGFTLFDWVDKIFDLACKESLTDSDLELLVNYQIVEASLSGPEFALFETTEKDRYNINILSEIKQICIDNNKDKLLQYTLS